MSAIEDRIVEIEEELHKTVYNKATQFHIGKLKAKLSQLKEEDLKRKSGGKKGEGFAVKKTGDATVVLVGFPSVGKSTLLNKLTSADSKIGAYDFTTLNVVPGMMEYNGMMIQILDLPGIISGAAAGKGRGREILSIVRNADLVLILLDATKLKHQSAIEKEIYDVGLRVDRGPPKASIQRLDRGGVSVISNIKLKKIDPNTIREVLNVYGIHNANVVLHEDMDVDRFIDAVVKNRIYVPSVIALNKMDLINQADYEKLKKEIGKEFIPISAEKGTNLELLKKKIFEKLGVIRVYTKRYGEKTVSDEPMIMKKGATVREACEGIHKDVISKFKFALVSGKSAKFEAQNVGLGHVLQDGDVLTVVTYR
jgi:uncharacterized protein